MVRGAPPGPAPADQALASSSRLTRSSWRTWPHRKLRREGSQGGWRLDRAAQGAGGSPSAQHVGVVNTVAARQRRRHQGKHLVARVRPVRGISEVNVVVDEFTQTQVLGEGEGEVTGRISPALATKRWSSKEIWIRSGCSSGSIYLVLPVSGWVSCSKNHYPRSTGALSYPFRTLTRRPPSVDSGLGELFWQPLRIMSGPCRGHGGGSSIFIPIRQSRSTTVKDHNLRRCGRQTPTEWLLQFMRAGVDCVAITDHNSGEWIDRLRTALAELEKEKHPEFQPLHLFPGVEITANGGTHILALFDPKTSSGEIAVLLGAVRYRGESGKSDVAAESAPIQVVEEIHKAGAIPILAHVDEPDGAWKMSGNTLAPLLDGGFPLAIEVRHLQRPSARTVYLQRKLEWAEVLGSDSHHPKYANVDRFPGSHFTWVKMSAPSIEGLTT